MPIGQAALATRGRLWLLRVGLLPLSDVLVSSFQLPSRFKLRPTWH